MEISGYNTRRIKVASPPVECGRRREGQKISHQIPGIYIQHKSEKDVSFGIFDVKESFGIHIMDKSKNLFDRQADFIKIHRSV
jgi:hypothetical protein